MLDSDWIVEGEALAMARPWPEELDELRGRGIRAVLSLTGGVPEGLAEAFEHLHLPVRDFHPPTPEQLDRGVAFLCSVVDAGGRVAVHCTAGRGRTGTFMAAYLVARGLSPEEAVREVRRRRPGSVETPEQEQAILAFARRRARVDARVDVETESGGPATREGSP